MKKIILSTLFVFLIIIVNAQKDIQFGKQIFGEQKSGFYKSYEDLLNDKVETPGEIDGWTIMEGFVKLEKKVIWFKDVSYYGFKDTHGNRYRIINGKAKNMVCAGKICLYTKGYQMNTSFDPKDKNKLITRGYYNSDHIVVVYFSSGSNEILESIKKVDNKEQVANLLFKDDMSIKNEYLNDSNDDLDPGCKRCTSDDVERIIFYVNKYNAAHK